MSEHTESSAMPNNANNNAASATTTSASATGVAIASNPIRIPADASIEDIRTHFLADKFATSACKARIVEAGRGYAVCEFDIESLHRNAAGAVMGGAIFTLADFALAVASNVGEPLTVSVSNTVEFISASKGTRLIATCTSDKSGMLAGFYTVDVCDDLGKAIAKMTAVCMR